MNEPATERYAVFGHPVGHSKSPTIHRLFAQQFDFEIDYRAIDVEPGNFAEAVQEFREHGGKGCNVTVPYKQEAWSLATERSGRAELAGAVNTLKFESENRILGDNTDGIGLLRDITINLDQLLFSKRVLVIGAGGAVRGILGPLLEQAPKSLVLANRTVARAEELASIFATIGPVLPCGFDALAGQQFDVVINGTSASLGGELPPLPENLFSRDSLAYDLMYSDRPTLYMEWAAAQGATRVADGLGMLVEQAAESFNIWFGRQPSTAPVIASLR
ncbi:MAG: shikimate dehydrogenase [Acidiferrobacterales bacterium]